MFMNDNIKGVVQSFWWLWGGQRIVTSRDNMIQVPETASSRMAGPRDGRKLTGKRDKPIEDV